MVNIKRRKLKAHILLEGLIALGLLAMVTSIVLGEIDKNRQSMQENLRQQGAFNAATMAVQAGQNYLKMNGVEVEIIKKDGEVYVYEGKTGILHVKKG